MVEVFPRHARHPSPAGERLVQVVRLAPHQLERLGQHRPHGLLARWCGELADRDTSLLGIGGHIRDEAAQPLQGLRTLTRIHRAE